MTLSEKVRKQQCLQFVVLARVAPWCPASDDLLNGADDTADEIMERIVRSATQGPSQRAQPRERRRSRVNRKSRKRRRHGGQR